MDPDPDGAEFDVAGVGVVVLAVDRRHDVSRSLVPVVAAFDVGAALLLKNK